MTIFFSCMLLCLTACEDDTTEYENRDVKVQIETGKNWLHDFPVMLGIKKKNPPQIAIWVEDTAGRYISTIYVSHKVSSQDWVAANGNRRKEALPHWCHKRGVQYDDGLYMPIKDEPVADALTGATPHSSSDVRMHPKTLPAQFVVKAEINHSIDWNNTYPKDAAEDADNYSGGSEGSGQPAIVYAVTVDARSGKKSFTADLIGHSSPDGSDGKLYPDTDALTSAQHIVKQITVSIR